MRALEARLDEDPITCSGSQEVLQERCSVWPARRPDGTVGLIAPCQRARQAASTFAL